MRKFSMIITTTALLASAVPSNARCSSGEIANFLCGAGVFSPGQAQTADKFNQDAGHPAEKLLELGITVLVGG